MKSLEQRIAELTDEIEKRAARYENILWRIALFRRIRARRGEQKAIMALAHELLTIVFTCCATALCTKSWGPTTMISRINRSSHLSWSNACSG